jgi:hypothetical protein
MDAAGVGALSDPKVVLSEAERARLLQVEKDIWEAHLADTAALLRGRGREVDEGSLRSLRDEATTTYESALRREVDDSVVRDIDRGEPLQDARAGGIFGFTQRLDDDRVIIGATKRADPVTALHELAHVFAGDLDDSARELVKRSRLTTLTENRTDIAERIAALEARKVGKSKTTIRRLDGQITALKHDLGEMVDEAEWGVQHEEWFVDEFNKWIKTGRPPHRDLENTFQHFRNWLTTIWSTIRGNKNIRQEAHPEMVGLFESMFSDRVASVPYNLQEHAQMVAAKQAVRQGMDEAQTTQYFKKGRSFVERSLNHPFLALYPVSYYWGKIIPEMFRFLALRPFGMETPLLGWNALREVSDTVRMQESLDPGLRDYMARNEDFFMTVSMLFPAVPSDMPMNTPLWARRIAEQGLENADAANNGRPTKPIDFMSGLADSAKWVFGPYASLEQAGKTLGWIGDTGRELTGQPQPGEALAGPAVPTQFDPLTGKPLN